MPNKSLITRRTCLRGLGVALALPLMETMGWADTAKGTAYRPPVRLGFMYMPHGVIMERFWPADPATFLTAPPPQILSALQPVLDQCLIMKGITGVPIAPFNGAPHALELSTWLTAALPDADKRDVVDIAISADQIAANYVGALTPLPSLELATMPQTHKENQEGLNEAYYSHCSYRGPTQPLPAEIDPRSVLKRLFQMREKGKAASPATAADALDRSMLDLVLGGAKDLRAQLTRDDQRKLDEYLDSVRSVERRIAAIQLRQIEATKAAAGLTTTSRAFKDSAPIDIKIPEGDKRSEYMQVMCDLNILAFQTDLTRVSTYIGSTPNGVSYPELGFHDEHHSVTHHNYEPVKLDKVSKINAFNVAQFAYMVKRMQSLREADGTLLDNCIMMWGSGLEDGNAHKREHLPFVIAGKGGGALKTGRYLPDIKGNQGDLLGTLLTCAGVPQDRPVGIATKQLTEMIAS
ncbi:MAG TPA: DUF1552 domain-containing protein [Tepidisphaeraceae bacterium]|jgi:hypothetical protein|nr:DUF1552 domain-containing protein [Tepidisphaeraceae bacterium]